MTLSNGTDHDLFLYGYNSAFEKPDGRMTSAWFDIKDAFGRPVTYKGRYVVSGAPPASAFTRIRPGTVLDGTVDLSMEYELPPAGSIDISTGVALYGRIPGIDVNGEMESVPHESVESNVFSFAVVHIASRTRPHGRSLKP
jgi:hypothetical protein